MHIEIGTGTKTLVIANMEKSQEIEAMLMRIASAYSDMVSLGYPEALSAYRKCKLIFTSEISDCTGVWIRISSLRSCGIYTDQSAYHKQIAYALYTMTGMNVYECADAAVEIGLGGIDAGIQGYVLLKDAVLGLSIGI